MRSVTGTLERAAPVEQPAPLGRRDRKKRTTRLALKAAAIDLVAERGFANVTVEDIAEAVDVSVRTFFNYFPSKEAALVGEDPELVEAMCSDLVALPGELTPLQALRTILFDRIHAIGEDLDLSGESHEVWFRRLALMRSQPEVLSAYSKHVTLLEQALTDALVRRLGDERQRIYAGIVTTSAMGAMRVVAKSWCGDGGTASLLQLASYAFDLLEGGLGTPSPAGRQVARATGGGRP